MFNISDSKGVRRCVTFLGDGPRRAWARMTPAVQGWYFHRLQEVALAEGVLGPVPVDSDTVVRIYYEPLQMTREDWLDFIDAYADEYPHIVEVLVVTKLEFIAVSGLRF